MDFKNNSKNFPVMIKPLILKNTFLKNLPGAKIQGYSPKIL